MIRSNKVLSPIFFFFFPVFGSFTITTTSFALFRPQIGFHVTVKVAHMYNVSPDFESRVSISVKSAGTGGHLQTRFASHQAAPASPDPSSSVIVFNQVFEFVTKLSPSGKIPNTFDKKIMSFASHVKV